jgi:pimeloyl-ACP methyl ester carboxylesterase
MFGRVETLALAASGLRFDAVAAGPADGRLVLLLHGFPQSARQWRRVAPVLARAGHRVVAPDQRGYSPGARPEGVAAYAMDELVGDVLGFADALGADRFDLVGHDFGAAVAWQAASRHPDRVRSLTAVSVPHPLAFTAALRSDPDQRERSAYMRRWREHTPDLDELRVEFGAIDGVAPPDAVRAAVNWYRAQSAADLQGLDAVRVPTLHVWSDRDSALGPVATHATGRYVEAPYRLVVLEGVSHWIPDEAPEALAAAILEHLAATR